MLNVRTAAEFQRKSIIKRTYRVHRYTVRIFRAELVFSAEFFRFFLIHFRADDRKVFFYFLIH